jgi:hypothetical protein
MNVSKQIHQTACGVLATGLLMCGYDTSAGLLARYTFDNPVDRSADSSGNNVDGTAGGGTYATTYISDTINGVSTTVLNSAGNDTRGFAIANTLIGAPTSTYSVAAWMKTTDTNGYLFGQYDNDGTTDRLIITPDSNNGVIYNGTVWTSGTKDAATRKADFVDGEWHHFAATVDGNNVTIYRDGVFYDSMVMPGGNNVLTPMSGNYRQRFGQDGDGSSGAEIEGRFDDLRVYDHTLTAQEVAALVPEPGSLALLGLGGLLIARRRRRA